MYVLFWDVAADTFWFDSYLQLWFYFSAHRNNKLIAINFLKISAILQLCTWQWLPANRFKPFRSFRKRARKTECQANRWLLFLYFHQFYWHFVPDRHCLFAWHGLGWVVRDDGADSRIQLCSFNYSFQYFNSIECVSKRLIVFLCFLWLFLFWL